jgi:hypothetical protein
MKKSITVLSVVVLTVCCAFVMFVGAGCDDDHHHGRKEFRSRRYVYEVHHERDRGGHHRNRHRGSRRHR